jgi:hypothetical protein
MTAGSGDGELRVRVKFRDHPALCYRADTVIAQHFYAAFGGSTDPAVTLDDYVTGGLGPLPCARLFEYE